VDHKHHKTQYAILHANGVIITNKKINKNPDVVLRKQENFTRLADIFVSVSSLRQKDQIAPSIAACAKRRRKILQRPTSLYLNFLNKTG
jgi:hypothetical protein